MLTWACSILKVSPPHSTTRCRLCLSVANAGNRDFSNWADPSVPDPTFPQVVIYPANSIAEKRILDLLQNIANHHPSGGSALKEIHSILLRSITKWPVDMDEFRYQRLYRQPSCLQMYQSEFVLSDGGMLTVSGELEGAVKFATGILV